MTLNAALDHPPRLTRRHGQTWRALLAALTLPIASAGMAAGAALVDDSAAAWRARFDAEVERRLEVPVDEQQRYIHLLQAALDASGDAVAGRQALLLVDRSVQVQAVFVLLQLRESEWSWLGASPVSTGRVGSFDHFLTPTGVFVHGPENPDFRAEGSFNSQHIRGYGLRGLRVFDFGWVQATRGWGRGGTSPMRLQMHATDPTLEPRLGRAESKGCIRIPSTLNVFVDRHGLLDAEYEAAQAAGRPQWVLRPDRQPVPWPGSLLVIVDSQRSERPDWSPVPPARP